MSDEGPIVAQKSPFKIDLKATYRYAWCACGLSKYQPFCDGSHTMSKAGLKPIVWTHEKDETRSLCGCKHTGNGPFCDGTHNKI